MDTMTILKEMQSTTDISHELNEIKDSTRQKNRCYLKQILSIILMLATGGVAFRGHDESDSSFNRGNFLNTVKLVRDCDPEFDEMCDSVPDNAKYTSAEIQNEMIETLAEFIRKAIVSDVGDSVWSVLVDECEDISHHEQMGVGIRYTDKKGVTKEVFIGVVCVPNTKAKTLLEKLVGFCEKFGLDMRNLRGQGYDGASNMSGHMGGLQALIKQQCPMAHYVHCFGHKLNLAVDGLVSGVPALFEFLEAIRHIRNLVTGSSKRQAILENALLDMEKMTIAEAEKYNRKSSGNNASKSLPEPCDTRWNGNHRLVDAMYDNFMLVYTALVTLIEDEGTSATQAAEMEGALSKVSTFTFFFCNVTMQPLFNKLDVLSKQFQRPRLDLEAAQSLAITTIDTLEEWRDEFDEIWKRTKKIVEEKNALLPDDDKVHIPSEDEKFVGRRGTRSRGKGRAGVPGADVPAAQSCTMKQHLKDSVYTPVYDKVIEELKRRFDTESMKEIFMGLDALSPRDSFSRFSVSRIVSFAEQYSLDFCMDDVDKREELEKNLKHWHKWVISPRNPYREEIKELKTVLGILEFMVERDIVVEFQKVFMLYKRAACLPVTSVEIERSFSSMSYIKNYLRNTMGDDRLSDLLLLYKSSDIASELDLEAVMLAWHSKKNRRICI